MTINNNTKPRFIMIVGIPGAGKTAYAESLVDDNTVHISSDNIRKELYGDESCQYDHNAVFSLMQQRSIKLLNDGFNVVYDATNVGRKYRKHTLSTLPKDIVKECVVVWASIGTCIKRDTDRVKSVGPVVIDKMLRRFEAPFYDEGFDTITVHMTEDLNKQDYCRSIFNSLRVPHDNPHHNNDIDIHCLLCGINLQYKNIPMVVKDAGYVHDIGKPYTKSFTNRKGEPTDIAHFYGHQGVGAWMSYGLLTESNIVTLAWLVSSHMLPLTNNKYYKKLSPEQKTWIDALHEADIAASK